MRNHILKWHYRRYINSERLWQGWMNMWNSCNLLLHSLSFIIIFLKQYYFTYPFHSLLPPLFPLPPSPATHPPFTPQTGQSFLWGDNEVCHITWGKIKALPLYLSWTRYSSIGNKLQKASSCTMDKSSYHC